MKLVITKGLISGEQVHIVVGQAEAEQTSCNRSLAEFGSPELGDYRIVHQSQPPLESNTMCPTCKRIYENERAQLNAWNQRVSKK